MTIWYLDCELALGFYGLPSIRLAISANLERSKRELAKLESYFT